MVWSNTDQSTIGAPFNEVFPSGTVEGTNVYRIGTGSTFEPASQGEVFELKIGPDVF